MVPLNKHIFYDCGVVSKPGLPEQPFMMVGRLVGYGEPRVTHTHAVTMRQRPRKVLPNDASNELEPGWLPLFLIEKVHGFCDRPNVCTCSTISDF